MGRAVAYGANNHNLNDYTNYGHGYRYAPYAAAATAAAYAYGRSDADDGCYNVSKYGRYGYRRVLVCNQD